MIIEFTNIISKIFSIKYLESSGLMISIAVLTDTICSHFFSKHFVVVLSIYNKPRLSLVYITSLVLLPRFLIDSLCKSALVLQL